MQTYLKFQYGWPEWSKQYLTLINWIEDDAAAGNQLKLLLRGIPFLQKDTFSRKEFPDQWDNKNWAMEFSDGEFKSGLSPQTATFSYRLDDGNRQMEELYTIKFQYAPLTKYTPLKKYPKLSQKVYCFYVHGMTRENPVPKEGQGPSLIQCLAWLLYTAINKYEGRLLGIVKLHAYDSGSLALYSKYREMGFRFYLRDLEPKSNNPRDLLQYNNESEVGWPKTKTGVYPLWKWDPNNPHMTHAIPLPMANQPIYIIAHGLKYVDIRIPGGFSGAYMDEKTEPTNYLKILSQYAEFDLVYFPKVNPSLPKNLYVPLPNTAFTEWFTSTKIPIQISKVTPQFRRLCRLGANDFKGGLVAQKKLMRVRPTLFGLPPQTFLDISLPLKADSYLKWHNTWKAYVTSIPIPQWPALRKIFVPLTLKGKNRRQLYAAQRDYPKELLNALMNEYQNDATNRPIGLKTSSKTPASILANYYSADQNPDVTYLSLDLRPDMLCVSQEMAVWRSLPPDSTEITSLFFRLEKDKDKLATRFDPVVYMADYAQWLEFGYITVNVLKEEGCTSLQILRMALFRNHALLKVLGWGNRACVLRVVGERVPLTFPAELTPQEDIDKLVYDPRIIPKLRAKVAKYIFPINK